MMKKLLIFSFLFFQTISAEPAEAGIRVNQFINDSIWLGKNGDSIWGGSITGSVSVYTDNTCSASIGLFGGSIGDLILNNPRSGLIYTPLIVGGGELVITGSLKIESADATLSTSLPNATQSDDTAVIRFIKDQWISPGKTLFIDNKFIFDGSGMSFSIDGMIAVDESSDSLTLRNMTLRGLHSGWINAIYANQVILDNVKIVGNNLQAPLLWVVPGSISGFAEFIDA
ncbi:TPA: hypothetical protein DEO28_01010 [Candidatus Dependentiae bacterium]|nr:MAG: hypothetical protein UR14_C0003G0052 [candidate division TM6 bacterium GW2011_GWE2_31_21]KKP54172.1 MAG: hypothetical protein UR43_C0001G0190 [candidate division TM6 bacterium GW2011_GWF2_33_332]HBS47894.1 hypothetical protein [Candidatus Dependentiae bacterium]HBZ73079.1 hypothetical protein [Candidatus Dependentiae bacterium]